MFAKFRRAKYAMYLAVLPRYRDACMEHLKASLGESLELFAAPAHLDRTVKTGILPSLYKETGILRIRNRAFVQYRHLGRAFFAQNLVVDLNPRSLTAWFLLVSRRLVPRFRTLVWGHLYPKLGKDTATAALRRLMRRLSNGTVSYTYAHKEAARHDLAKQEVWAAPNALYSRDAIHGGSSDVDRNRFLYVGRLEPSKKPDMLIDALQFLPREIGLTIAGGGSMEATLQERVVELGMRDRVSFLGWVEKVDELRAVYGTAFASVSPGFAGLALTQSLGFGVPQAVSRDEMHSPEIELESTGGVRWFETDSSEDLARVLLELQVEAASLPLPNVSEYVRMYYSAETMADGLSRALIGSMR